MTPEDMTALWASHCRFEFELRDVEGALSTMVDDPYLWNIPTMCGGRGQEGMRRYYRDPPARPPAVVSATPPVAPRRPTVLAAHGDERIDDWYWLRDRDDPQVRAYLDAENAYTREVMARTEPLQRQLFEEIKSRVQETDESAPVRKGPYEYFSRTIEGRQYGIQCRRPGGTPG